MLASRIKLKDFPDELVNVVADNIADLVGSQIRSLCDASTDWEGRLENFGITAMLAAGGRIPAEKAAMDQLERLNVAVIPIPISRPRARAAHWVHLSAADVRPRLHTNDPSTRKTAGPSMSVTIQQPTSTSWAFEIRTQCRLDSGTRSLRDRLDFHPRKLAADSILFDRPWQTPAIFDRLLQLDGLDEAIKAWKQEDVKKFVTLLKLRVVATVGEEGAAMLPKIRLLHVVKAM
ncbi:hypothetical protein B0A48_17431 [Cryoendolithus antarcticus]|uniref:Uncharacterized protein n=1 Tax=Cryoendolithus antarcticus TaxID=1507870 RepID=A0A1V8SCV5_9PEZI|nr:hypothetical protein B0A48_17431 [Cryoendolithus antarcticus]